MENTEQEKKHLEETTDILFIQQVPNCPFCGKTLKAQNVCLPNKFQTLKHSLSYSDVCWLCWICRV